jgi:uncharacterized protein (DUF111 family)
MHHAERLKAGREVREIETPLGPVRVKLKTIGADIIAVTPEYDDCRVLAEKLKLPVETVMAQVTHAARTHFHLDAARAEAGAEQEE